MDVRTNMVYGMVSAQVSAGDGIQNFTTNPQPPPLVTGSPAAGFPSAVAIKVSAPQFTWAELVRRMVTHITTPSSTLISGGSAGAVAITVTGAVSGIQGMIQGMPFQLSAAGHLSAQPTSLISTASTTIRKVLVTIGMSALPVQSSLALGGGTVQFVYGSAYTTSAGIAVSGGESTFDFVPLPVPSANEVPVGWLNVYNSFAVSAGIANTMMWSDLRAIQGINMSALWAGVPQP